MSQAIPQLDGLLATCFSPLNPLGPAVGLTFGLRIHSRLPTPRHSIIFRRWFHVGSRRRRSLLSGPDSVLLDPGATSKSCEGSVPGVDGWQIRAEEKWRPGGLQASPDTSPPGVPITAYCVFMGLFTY